MPESLSAFWRIVPLTVVKSSQVIHVRQLCDACDCPKVAPTLVDDTKAMRMHMYINRAQLSCMNRQRMYLGPLDLLTSVPPKPSGK